MQRGTATALRAILALLLPLPAQAAPKPFQKVENCQWKADRYNDGDSFHATLGDGKGEITEEVRHELGR